MGRASGWSARIELDQTEGWKRMGRTAGLRRMGRTAGWRRMGRAAGWRGLGHFAGPASTGSSTLDQWGWSPCAWTPGPGPPARTPQARPCISWGSWSHPQNGQTGCCSEKNYSYMHRVLQIVISILPPLPRQRWAAIDGQKAAS